MPSAWRPADPERWRCYLGDDENLVFYCPDCAEHEFGKRLSRPTIARAPALVSVPPCSKIRRRAG